MAAAALGIGGRKASAGKRTQSKLRPPSAPRRTLLNRTFIPLVVASLSLVSVRGERDLLDGECSGHGHYDEEWDDCLCETGYDGERCELCDKGYAGWPHCQSLSAAVEPGAARYGWADLCAQFASLAAESPNFLARLGELYEARQSVLPNGHLLQLRENVTEARLGFGGFWGSSKGQNCKTGGGGSEGPWKLKVDISAPTSAPTVMAKQHRIVLEFSKEWPQAPPKIRFVGKIGSPYAVSTDEQPKDKFAQDLHVAEASSLFYRRLQEATRALEQEGKKKSKKPAQTPLRYDLRHLLEVLHSSLGGPLHASDRRLWQSAVASFGKEASTVLKYQDYGRKHHHLFDITQLRAEDLIVSDLLQTVHRMLQLENRTQAKEELLKSGLVEEVLPDDVFSFRVFSEEFCELLMEEIHHFYGSKLPARRPNSMNNYGIILNEIGLESLVFALQDAIIQPLAAILLPNEGSELEAHHSFTIRYRGGEDTHLDVHTDDSDITFNVNVFGNYTGAPLVFCGINGEPNHRLFRTSYQHRLGYAVLHRGRHRHGAEDITSGERMNLVVWSYSPTYRSSDASRKVHQKEARKPDLRCLSYTHDRDFAQFRDFPPEKKSRYFGRGWCPPRGKEYDGFVPDLPDSAVRQRQQQGQ